MGKTALRLLPIFKANIIKIYNLTINKSPAKAEELVQSPELIELNSEIMNEMIIRSTISDNDKKK